MQKHILYGFSGVISTIILTKIGAFNALVMFLLVGAVPGTNYSLSSGAMLGIIVAATIISIAAFATTKVMRNHAASQISKRSKLYKKHLPRRRLSQV